MAFYFSHVAKHVKSFISLENSFGFIITCSINAINHANSVAIGRNTNLIKANPTASIITTVAVIVVLYVKVEA